MLDKIKFTLITPCLNNENTIECTIRSVISQKVDVEYIIIDGGSIDKTIDIIRKYEHRIAFLVSEPDRGIYDAINKGLKRASGNVIGIIMADDWYEYGALKKVENAFIENPETQIVHGKMRLWASDTKSYNIINPDINSIYVGMSINHPTCFIKKEVYDKFGLYDDSFRISGDYEFILRVIDKVKLNYIKDILVNMGDGGVSVRKWNTALLENIRAKRKYVNPIKCYVTYLRLATLIGGTNFVRMLRRTSFYSTVKKVSYKRDNIK